MPSLVREGEIFAGRYRVEHILGEGGHGLVFAARNLELDQRVAVKLLKRASADDTTADRFFREARAAQKIRGEGVARVFAVDQLEDGDLYMVMEYLDGRDLKKEVAARGKLEVHDAVDCILQACDVIGRAHAMGIVHRDIKSANLFSVTRDDGRRQIKVLDFGIARSLDPVEASLTQSPQMMGSPLYMAPEQIVDGRTVDERADIWGLGATLFELLAGVPPFGGGTLLQLLLRVQEHPPDDLRALRPAVPADLQRVVERCLEKQRDRRFPDVGSLAAALGSFRVPVSEAASNSAAGAGEAAPASFAAASLAAASFAPAASRAPSSELGVPWSAPDTPTVAVQRPSSPPDEVAHLAVRGPAAPLAATVVSAVEPARAASRPSLPPLHVPDEAAPAATARASSTLVLVAVGAAALVVLLLVVVSVARRGVAAGARRAAESEPTATPAPVPVPMPMPSPGPVPTAFAAPPPALAASAVPAASSSSQGVESAVATPTSTATSHRAGAAPRGGRGSRVGSGAKASAPGAPSAHEPAPMPDDRQ